MRWRIRSLSARSRRSERIGHSSCWTAQRQPARALCGSTRTSGATCVAGHQVLTRYSRCRPRASVATVLRRTVCIASCTRSSGSVLWTISDGLCSAGNLLLNDRPAWTVDVRPAALRYGGCHRIGIALLSGSNHAARSNPFTRFGYAYIFVRPRSRCAGRCAQDCRASAYPARWPRQDVAT